VLTNGPVPGDAHVLHRCDVRACVRPSHLFLGTHADNMTDRDEKGRTPNGEDCTNAKLTWAAVEEIRKADGVAISALARKHGVSRISIRRVLSGETWGGGLLMAGSCVETSATASTPANGYSRDSLENRPNSADSWCPGTESNRRHGDFQAVASAREHSGNSHISAGGWPANGRSVPHTENLAAVLLGGLPSSVARAVEAFRASEWAGGFS